MLQRYRQSFSLTVKWFAIIQVVTFREKLCDGLLIKFTLKIQDAPLFLCLLLTGRSDKISSQLPSHVCFLTSNRSSRVPGYTAHPTFSWPELIIRLEALVKSYSNAVNDRVCVFFSIRYTSEHCQELGFKTQYEHKELQDALSISSEGRTSKYITRLQFHKHKHVASQTRAG